ncbi:MULTISPECIES: helix-turn-helix domain-containing protein [unclassified Bradyrhizobium]|uniref:helix-turn-helix domain-containing protein n=1 Tax=unclassified Bradyrhizobium TaxID=2631580 RepID=UPI001FCDCE78|nr:MULTISPECIES: helix-turn-helix domain-containing protein [unclassified Bradyrhizobium]
MRRKSGLPCPSTSTRRSTTQPIKAIARTTGYEDESSFRKAFRKLTLMSPQAYRARRMERTM